jgi:hypothetical protein
MGRVSHHTVFLKDQLIQNLHYLLSEYRNDETYFLAFVNYRRNLNNL